MTNGTSQLVLTLCGFPVAVGIQVNTGATGDIRGPTTEHSMAVVGPVVVVPALNTTRFVFFVKTILRMIHRYKILFKNNRLTSSLLRPIHMGVCARLTCTVRVDCREISVTLARSMLLFLHCSKASNQVRFLTSRRMVWLLTWNRSVWKLGSSVLSEKRTQICNLSVIQWVAIEIFVFFFYLHNADK